MTQAMIQGFLKANLKHPPHLISEMDIKLAYILDEEENTGKKISLYKAISICARWRS